MSIQKTDVGQANKLYLHRYGLILHYPHNYRKAVHTEHK